MDVVCGCVSRKNQLRDGLRSRCVANDLPVCQGARAIARNATFDYARLIAAFGIVLFHADAPGAAYGYAALPFFLMLLLVLAWPAAQRVSFGRYLRGRAERLLLPFIVWSIVFGALKVAQVLLTGATVTSEFNVAMLLTGPAIHLWFLPFAFVASLAVHPLALSYQARSNQTRSNQARSNQAGPKSTEGRAPGVWLIALTVLALITIGLRQGVALPVPYAQWAAAMPSVFLGLAFAVAQNRFEGPALATGLICLVAYLAGWTDGLLQLGLAAGALALCSAIKLPETALSRLAASAAMGVYLCHPLIYSILDRTIALPQRSIGIAVAGGAGALLVTLLIGSSRQFPLTLLFGPQDTGPVLRQLFGRFLRRA